VVFFDTVYAFDKDGLPCVLAKHPVIRPP
ncbi:unnamed protein product, partial [Allacma fusca]